MVLKLENLKDLDGNTIFLLSGSLIFMIFCMLLILEIVCDMLNFLYNLFFSKKEKLYDDSTRNELYKDFIGRYKYDDRFVRILNEYYYLERKMNVGDMVEIVNDNWFGKCGYVTRVNDDETLNIKIPKYLNAGKVPKGIITKNYRDIKYLY